MPSKVSGSSTQCTRAFRYTESQFINGISGPHLCRLLRSDMEELLFRYFSMAKPDVRSRSACHASDHGVHLGCQAVAASSRRNRNGTFGPICPTFQLVRWDEFSLWWTECARLSGHAQARTLAGTWPRRLAGNKTVERYSGARNYRFGGCAGRSRAVAGEPALALAPAPLDEDGALAGRRAGFRQPRTRGACWPRPD